MRKYYVGLLLCGFFLFMSACKSEFEKIRVSGKPDLILKSAFEYYDQGKYQRAQTLFDLVQSSLRGRPEAEKANFYYAYTYFHLKQYVLGAYYFKTFSNTFTGSQFREEAAYMSAYCNYLQSPTYRLDQSSTVAAIEEFQTFVNLFPLSSRVEQCNKLIDEMRRKQEEKAYQEGILYYDLRQYQSAVLVFDNMLKDYPDTPFAESIYYHIAKGSHLLSENSVVEKRPDRYAEAIKRCEDFMQKYPSSKNFKEVQKIKKDAERDLKAAKEKLKTT